MDSSLSGSSGVSSFFLEILILIPEGAEEGKYGFLSGLLEISAASWSRRAGAISTSAFALAAFALFDLLVAIGLDEKESWVEVGVEAAEVEGRGTVEKVYVFGPVLCLGGCVAGIGCGCVED